MRKTNNLAFSFCKSHTQSNDELQSNPSDKDTFEEYNLAYFSFPSPVAGRSPTLPMLKSKYGYYNIEVAQSSPESDPKSTPPKAAETPYEPQSNLKGKEHHLQRIKIGTSSVLFSIFQSTNFFVGIGVLAVPYAVSLTGWLGLACLFLFYFIMSYTAVLLGSIRNRLKLESFSDIVEFAFATPGRVVISAIFYTWLFFNISLFLKLVPSSIAAMISSMSITTCQWLSTVIYIVLSQFCHYKVVLRCLSVLGSLSALLMCLSIMTTFILIISRQHKLEYDLISHKRWSEEYKHTEVNANEVHPSLIFPATTSIINLSASNWLKSQGVFCFCYVGHEVLPSIFRNMHKPTRYRVVINIAFVAMLIGYTLIAATGYLIFGPYTVGNITLNLPHGSIGFLCAQVFLICTVSSKLLLSIAPLTEGLLEWCSLALYLLRHSKYISELLKQPSRQIPAPRISLLPRSSSDGAIADFNKKWLPEMHDKETERRRRKYFKYGKKSGSRDNSSRKSSSGSSAGKRRTLSVPHSDRESIHEGIHHHQYSKMHRSQPQQHRFYTHQYTDVDKPTRPRSCPNRLRNNNNNNNNNIDTASMGIVHGTTCSAKETHTATVNEDLTSNNSNGFRRSAGSVSDFSKSSSDHENLLLTKCDTEFVSPQVVVPNITISFQDHNHSDRNSSGDKSIATHLQQSISTISPPVYSMPRVNSSNSIDLNRTHGTMERKSGVIMDLAANRRGATTTTSGSCGGDGGDGGSGYDMFTPSPNNNRLKIPTGRSINPVNKTVQALGITPPGSSSAFSTTHKSTTSSALVDVNGSSLSPYALKEKMVYGIEGSRPRDSISRTSSLAGKSTSTTAKINRKLQENKRIKEEEEERDLLAGSYDYYDDLDLASTSSDTDQIIKIVEAKTPTQDGSGGGIGGSGGDGGSTTMNIVLSSGSSSGSGSELSSTTTTATAAKLAAKEAEERVDTVDIIPTIMTTMTARPSLVSFTQFSGSDTLPIPPIRSTSCESLLGLSSCDIIKPSPSPAPPPSVPPPPPVVVPVPSGRNAFLQQPETSTISGSGRSGGSLENTLNNTTLPICFSPEDTAATTTTTTPTTTILSKVRSSSGGPDQQQNVSFDVREQRSLLASSRTDKFPKINEALPLQPTQRRLQYHGTSSTCTGELYCPLDDDYNFDDGDDGDSIEDRHLYSDSEMDNDLEGDEQQQQRHYRIELLRETHRDNNSKSSSSNNNNNIHSTDGSTANILGYFNGSLLTNSSSVEDLHEFGTISGGGGSSSSTSYYGALSSTSPIVSSSQSLRFMASNSNDSLQSTPLSSSTPPNKSAKRKLLSDFQCSMDLEAVIEEEDRLLYYQHHHHHHHHQPPAAAPPPPENDQQVSNCFFEYFKAKRRRVTVLCNNPAMCYRQVLKPTFIYLMPFLMRMILLLLAMCAGWMFGDFADMLTVVGGVLGIIITVIIPAICYLRVNKQSITQHEYMILCGILLIGCFVVLSTLLEAIFLENLK